MSLVALLGIGSGAPGQLTVDSLDRLRRAQVLIVDPHIDDGSWCHEAPSSVRVERVAGEGPEAWERARMTMVEAARGGARVVRLRLGDGWTEPEALRDARVLRDAGLDYEILPGVASSSHDWKGWLASRPLYGRRIVVTRMRDQASRTAELLRERGADPWVVPTIELYPPEDPSPLEQALRSLSSYDLVAFTSANGVEQVFAALERDGRDARAFGSARVAAIGAATARSLRDRGILVDLVAKEFRGESLAEGISEMAGVSRVLIPRAKEAREILPESLREAGFAVDVVVAYETRAAHGAALERFIDGLEHRGIDAVLLTSSSTARNLCEVLGGGYRELLSGTCLASIGPITSETAEKLGLSMGVTASEFTLPGLIHALEAHFAP